MVWEDQILWKNRSSYDSVLEDHWVVERPVWVVCGNNIAHVARAKKLTARERLMGALQEALSVMRKDAPAVGLAAGGRPVALAAERQNAPAVGLAAGECAMALAAERQDAPAVGLAAGERAVPLSAMRQDVKPVGITAGERADELAAMRDDPPVSR